MAGRGAEVILGTPVRERRSSHQMFLTDSIEETEEETYSVQDLDVSTFAKDSSPTPSRQAPEPSSGSQATQTSVHVSACTQTGSESTQVQTLQVFPGAATADQGESSA